MEIEAYQDAEQDCYVVILWKGDVTSEKHRLASIEEVDAIINLLRRHYPDARVLYGV